MLAKAADVAANALHPAWRSTMVLVVFGALATQRGLPIAPSITTPVQRLERLTAEVRPALRAMAPSGAPYLNEVNFAKPDLVRQTFGPNLARLRAGKHKYDPDSVDYAFASVISADWAADATGRLCQVA